MKFIFNPFDDNIILPKSALFDKIQPASENEIKVLLYAALLSSEGSAFDESDIQKISGFDTTDIIIALQFWRGAGVLSLSDNRTQKSDSSTSDKLTDSKNSEKPLRKVDVPVYSGEEIASLFDKNSEIKLLIDECQNIAGKVFNPHEINKIISLYDYLGLSCEYIMLLYNYCKGKNKTTVHYVEKTAFNLYDEGVDTAQKLQEYIKFKERFDSIAGKICIMFGLGNRALTKKEEKHIEKWTEEWAFPLDMIEYAYELTVNATNKASIPYANKILENWHNLGISSLESAKQAEFDHKKSSQPLSDNSSFDDDEFFQAALKRSYDNIGKSPDKQQ